MASQSGDDEIFQNPEVSLSTDQEYDLLDRQDSEILNGTTPIPALYDLPRTADSKNNDRISAVEKTVKNLSSEFHSLRDECSSFMKQFNAKFEKLERMMKILLFERKQKMESERDSLVKEIQENVSSFKKEDNENKINHYKSQLMEKEVDLARMIEEKRAPAQLLLNKKIKRSRKKSSGKETPFKKKTSFLSSTIKKMGLLMTSSSSAEANNSKSLGEDGIPAPKIPKSLMEKPFRSRNPFKSESPKFEKVAKEKENLERKIRELEHINSVITSKDNISFVYGNSARDCQVRGLAGMAIKTSLVRIESINEVQFFEEVYKNKFTNGKGERFFQKKIKKRVRNAFVAYFGSWKTLNVRQGEEYFNIALEAAKWDLEKFLKKHKKLEEFTLEKRMNIVIKIVECCLVLHENKLAHCDLKPQNIGVFDDKQHYINGTLTIKLMDFEYVQKQDDEHFGLCGTFDFMDPSLVSIDRNQIDEFKIQRDVFSLACIIFFTLFDKSVFDLFFKVTSSCCFLPSGKIPIVFYELFIMKKDFVVFDSQKGLLAVFEEQKIGGDKDAEELLERIQLTREKESFLYLGYASIDEVTINKVPKHFFILLDSMLSFNEKTRPATSDILSTLQEIEYQMKNMVKVNPKEIAKKIRILKNEKSPSEWGVNEVEEWLKICHFESEAKSYFELYGACFEGCEGNTLRTLSDDDLKNQKVNDKKHRELILEKIIELFKKEDEE